MGSQYDVPQGKVFRDFRIPSSDSNRNDRLARRPALPDIRERLSSIALRIVLPSYVPEVLPHPKGPFSRRQRRRAGGWKQSPMVRELHEHQRLEEYLGA